MHLLVEALPKGAMPLKGLIISKEAFAAIVGAIIGGVMTYWAAYAVEKWKQRKLELSISSLVLNEVLGHFASIEFALDRVLPHWLKRKRATYEQDYLLENTSVLSSNVFDQFFSTLAITNAGPFLVLYYNRVRRYNRYAATQPAQIPYSDLHFYVHCLAVVMEGGIDLIDRLRHLKGMDRVMPREFRVDLENADEHRARCSLMAALCRTDETEISNLIEGKLVSSGMPEAILQASPEQLRNWVR